MTYHIATAWAYSKDLISLFHQFLNSTANLIPASIRNKPIQIKVQFSFSQVTSTFIHNSCTKVTRLNRNMMTAPYTFWLFSSSHKILALSKNNTLVHIVVKMFH